jgi:steroid delta-isomerase-like uncharacterized protein
MSVAADTFAADLVEAWNSHDIDLALSFYADDYEGVDVGDPAAQCGPEGARQMLQRYLIAFPDLHFTIEGVASEGQRVTLTWVACGTHLGQWLNIPPSGRTLQMRGVSLLTLSGAKICRASYMWDMAAVLRQIGLV